jgi:hypothetical protein
VIFGSDQVTGGDLEHVGQGDDIREAVEGDLSALDPVQLRLAHPRQPRDHRQWLAPGLADLAHSLADRARVVKVHRTPLPIAAVIVPRRCLREHIPAKGIPGQAM